MSDINKVLGNIEKQLGKGMIATERDDVNFIPSGSIKLDIALGGGFALGRIVELMGWESSGKSTIALHACAEAQKMGLKILYIDVEQAFDSEYAEALGIDVCFDKPIDEKTFFLSQPDSTEQSFEMVDKFLELDDLGLVIVDSVAAMTPQSEIDGDMGDSKMGLQARLMGQGMRKLVKGIKANDICVLFLNQFREKLNVIFGDNRTTPGGNALKFYASQRVEVSKKGQGKDGEDILSQGCMCKIIKNKVGVPFRKALLSIKFGEGIDKLQEIIDLAIEEDIIHRGGSWFSYGDVFKVQGQPEVRSLMEDNEEMVEEIRDKILTNLGFND